MFRGSVYNKLVRVCGLRCVKNMDIVYLRPTVTRSLVNKTINNMMLTGQLTEERMLSVNVNLTNYCDI